MNRHCKIGKQAERTTKIRELPPPIDLQNIPRCRECQSMEVDANLMTNFNVRACRKCIKALPENTRCYKD